jgi:hypothetical protein
MTHRLRMRFAWLLLLAACTAEKRPQASPDAGCDEPDPRNPKGLAEGEPCESSFDCNSADLVCLGMGTDRQPVCTSDTVYDDDARGVHLELWDDACWAEPESAPVGHCDDADLVDSTHIDTGCDGERRVYEIADPCCPDAQGICRHDCVDYLRHEEWRNCGCCWRLVQLVEVMPEECVR